MHMLKISVVDVIYFYVKIKGSISVMGKIQWAKLSLWERIYVDIQKIEYDIEDEKRINLPREVAETYFLAIFKKQARQNITESD
jgi:hypothetical protein